MHAHTLYYVHVLACVQCLRTRMRAVVVGVWLRWVGWLSLYRAGTDMQCIPMYALKEMHEHQTTQSHSMPIYTNIVIL